MAVLHYGTESFQLPASTEIGRLLSQLTWAVPGARMIPVHLERGTIHIAVGGGIPVWIDERA